MSETRSYPRHANTDAGEIEFRLMSRGDEAAVLDFAKALPTHDLLFLPRNISQGGLIAVHLTILGPMLVIQAQAKHSCGITIPDRFIGVSEVDFPGQRR